MADDVIRLKPHHFIDIINYYGADCLRLTPHPKGHGYHRIAQRLLDERQVMLEMVWGVDDICAPCRDNVDGVCVATIDTSDRPDAPPLMRDYNLLLDQRWSARLGLIEGQWLRADQFARKLLALSGSLREVYAEMPAEFSVERLRNILRGARRYLEGS